MQKLTFHWRVSGAILCLGLIVTGLAALHFNRTLEERYELRLTSISREVVTQLASSVNVITYGLGGANGVFAASKSVERSEFRDYVNSRNLPMEFPGTSGFGFIEYVKRENLESFILDARADGQADFQLKTLGNHPHLYVIKYLEPAEGNKFALGYDIASDSVTRQAADLAMLSGKPTLSGRVQLAQDPESHAGFLYLRPVFRNGSQIDTAETRKAALYGWVYAPFTLERVVKPVVERFGALVSLTIFERQGKNTEALIFSALDPSRSSAFDRSLNINIGQQQWRVLIQPNSAFFDQDSSRYLPLTTVFAGLLITFIASALTWLNLNAKNQNLSSRLQEGENLIKGILESSNFAIVVTKPDGVIKIFNRAATELLGYSAEEVIDKATPAKFHLESEIIARAEVLSKKLNRPIEPGFEVFVAESRENLPSEIQWTYVRKDGTRFPVALSVTAMRDEQGAIVAFMGIANDISERKEAERELQRSEESFRTSFDYASHGIALVGLDGKWLKVNRALTQMLGRSEEELLKGTFQDITHPQDLNEDLALVKRTLSGEIDNYHMEKRYFHVDGHIVWALLGVALVRDVRGAPVHFVSQIQDITDRKLTELKLQEKTQELILAKDVAESAAQAKSQFLANMTHEIRTPLTSIIGYSESLMNDTLSATEQNIALETIMKNGTHLLGVVNDILDISKIEAGKLEIEVMPIALFDLIEDVGNLMQQKASEKGLSLGFEYSFPIPATIYTDSVKLKQILINLMGNAVKFTTVGGVKIHVTYDQKDKRLSFAIIDTGPGLTIEERSKLFQAFSQADTSITRKFGGTGLGLTISSEFAKRLGGEITLESEPGTGSVFTLTIAAGEVQLSDLTFSIPSSSSSKKPEVADVPSFSGKVLVAEDGEDNRNLISFLLKKANAEFVIVENGALAVEEALSTNFDLILMDIQMPVMDGYTAASVIREHGLTTPIVALTANALKADVERAREAGCSDFLGKPFTRKELYMKLSKYINIEDSDIRPAKEEIGAETMALLQEDPELLEIVLSVLRGFTSEYNELVTAAQNKDWKTTGYLAHRMTGSAANMGFLGVAAVSRTIEYAANKNNAEVVFANFEPLKDAMDKARSMESSLLSLPLSK